MPLKLVMPASALAVSLVEAKLHLRVDVADDDALITALIGAATLSAEHIMGRAVMPQKWCLYLDAFAGKVDLQRAGVTAVDSVNYVNAAGTLTLLSASGYQFSNGSDYAAALVPAYGQAWPATRCQPEAVQILFSCGYADAANVPEPIKAWIKLLIGTLYVNRESESEMRGNLVSLGVVDCLLDRYRTWRL